MKNKAALAREGRLKAAQRLIEQHTPLVQPSPKQPKQPTLRMVQPKELEITIVAA